MHRGTIQTFTFSFRTQYMLSASKLRPRSRRLWWRAQDDDEGGTAAQGRSLAADTAAQPQECKQQ